MATRWTSILLYDHSINLIVNHSYQLIDLEVKGFHYSGLKQFEYCKNSNADLVYSVEDDYLHCTEAIQEMLFSYGYLKSYYHLQKELCLFPFDNPEDYEYTFIIPGRLFRTPTRHWKEGIWTTFTMMTKPKVFRNHWEVFEKLASQYTPWNGIDEIKELVHEGNTISNIWEHYVTRVNPVPSLALICDDNKAPVIVAVPATVKLASSIYKSLYMKILPSFINPPSVPAISIAFRLLGVVIIKDIGPVFNVC